MRESEGEGGRGREREGERSGYCSLKIIQGQANYYVLTASTIIPIMPSNPRDYVHITNVY